MKTALTLYQFNNQVRQAVKEAFPFYYWITAEILELNESQRGHCYLELIERENDKITASAKAVIWTNNYLKIQTLFTQGTGIALGAGMKVMLNVGVEMHEQYGYSLIVQSIEPSYTAGEMAKDKRLIIERLTKEGILNMNKELELPTVIQRIAVISSATAAGYQDFVTQLEGNPRGYYFKHQLFQATMQGDLAVKSIIDALELIFENEADFDAVVIIRGGGAQTDLNCFDNYDLAANVAQFPLPVLTGIGHERDHSIVDLVAFHHLKTPTAVAEFILERSSEFENNLDGIFNYVKIYIDDRLSSENTLLTNFTQRVKHNAIQQLSHNDYLIKNAEVKLETTVRNLFNSHNIRLTNCISKLSFLAEKQISEQKHRLNFIINHLELKTKNIFRSENDKLNFMEETVNLLNPENILKKGFSITTINGKLIRNINEIKVKDILKTRILGGIIESEVRELKKNKPIDLN